MDGWKRNEILKEIKYSPDTTISQEEWLCRQGGKLEDIGYRKGENVGEYLKDIETIKAIDEFAYTETETIKVRVCRNNYSVPESVFLEVFNSFTCSPQVYNGKTPTQWMEDEIPVYQYAEIRSKNGTVHNYHLEKSIIRDGIIYPAGNYRRVTYLYTPTRNYWG